MKQWALLLVAVALVFASAESPSSERYRGDGSDAVSLLSVSDGFTPRHDYKADSGGCQPMTVWEKEFEGPWWNWEARLPSLAKKLQGKKDGDRAAEMLFGLGDKNMWLQIVDGWAHLKGKHAFGPEYVDDMKKAFKMCAKQLKEGGFGPKSLNEAFYDKIHTHAFKQTATILSKRNGYRGPHSGVYLPLPDKPLAVFHDIHDNGKMTYDPKLRRIDRNSADPKGWKYNQGYLMRWVYPNMQISFGKEKVTGYFDEFWKEIQAIDPKLAEGNKRDIKLTAIVKLYHALENFHCFIDGNGRTNILVLDSLLSWVGLHPVSFYNSMESALASVDEMREKVMEGYYMWEQAYKNLENKVDFPSGWTLDAIQKKNQECKTAIAALWGKGDPFVDSQGVAAFISDTQGGCMCQDVSHCESNTKFAQQKWCHTTSDCTWKWDFCAPGRKAASKA